MKLNLYIKSKLASPIYQDVFSFEQVKVVCKLPFRSSHRRCTLKKDVLKNFAKFTGKHLFFNKVAGLRLDDGAKNTKILLFYATSRD